MTDTLRLPEEGDAGLTQRHAEQQAEAPGLAGWPLAGGSVLAPGARPSSPGGPDHTWRERIARIRALESRLAIAEVEQDLALSDHGRLARIRQLEAQVAALTADNDARLAVIRRLESRVADLTADNGERLIVIRRLEARVADVIADNGERLALVQRLTGQIAELADDGEKRLAIIHELTTKVGALKATRTELERIISSCQARTERLSREADDAHALRQRLEATIAEQAFQIQALMKEQAGRRAGWRALLRDLIRRPGSVGAAATGP